MFIERPSQWTWDSRSCNLYFIMVVKANISRVYLKIIIHILIYYRFGGSALCNVLLRQNCGFDSHSIAHLIFDLIWPLYLQNSYVFINYFEHLFSIIGWDCEIVLSLGSGSTYLNVVIHCSYFLSKMCR